MKELIEAYRQFPEWFTKVFRNVRCAEVIDFSSLANPYMFQFNFYNLKMRVKLDFDRFQNIYYKDGKRDVDDTYHILANKIYNQFLTEVQRTFEKKIRGVDQYE